MYLGHIQSGLLLCLDAAYSGVPDLNYQALKGVHFPDLKTHDDFAFDPHSFGCGFLLDSGVEPTMA